MEARPEILPCGGHGQLSVLVAHLRSRHVREMDREPLRSRHLRLAHHRAQAGAALGARSGGRAPPNFRQRHHGAGYRRILGGRAHGLLCGGSTSSNISNWSISDRAVLLNTRSNLCGIRPIVARIRPTLGIGSVVMKQVAPIRQIPCRESLVLPDDAVDGADYGEIRFYRMKPRSEMAAILDSWHGIENRRHLHSATRRS